MLVHLFQTKNPNFLDWISAFYTFLGKGLPSTLQPYRHFLTSNSVINLKKFSLFGFISTLRYVFFFKSLQALQKQKIKSRGHYWRVNSNLNLSSYILEIKTFFHSH